MKLFVFSAFILFLSCGIRAQQFDTMAGSWAFVQGTDTVVFRQLPEIRVAPRRQFRNAAQYRRYWRYVQRVKKVYPLALEARQLLEEYAPRYYELDKQSDRRKLMRELERDLLAKHKDELKKWSISDGRLLLKLITRETQRTPYSIIRDFRGGFSAAFWQGVAKIFRNDLKTGYDPYGDDQWLEEIVTLIELGVL